MIVSRILLLAASPSDQESLRLNNEYREIDSAVKNASYACRVEIRQAPAIRIEDLVPRLLEHRPLIVHFSGHGGDGSIALQSKYDTAVGLSAAQLGGVLSACPIPPSCIVLNCCHSSGMAEQLVAYVDAAIGMSGSISDDAAIAFARTLYITLASGESLQVSFNMARAQMAASHPNDSELPQLFVRSTVDAESFKLRAGEPPGQQTNDAVDEMPTLGALTPVLFADSGDDQIDAAAQHLNDGKAESALTLLEQIRRRRWDQLSARQRYRVLANMGHAHEAQESYEAAGRLYIEAASHQPNDSTARAMEAGGHFLLGDRATAHSLAQQVRASDPHCTMAMALVIRTAPEDVPLATLEGQLRPGDERSLDIANALSWRAYSSRAFVKAVDFARLALSQRPDSKILQEHLAGMLIETCRSEFVSMLAERPQLSHPEYATEALDILDDILSAGGVPLPIPTKARLHFYRGLAMQLRHLDAEMVDEWRKAHAFTPHDPKIAWHLALHLGGGSEHQRDEAIDILGRTVALDDTPRGEVLLAHLLGDRARPLDKDNAIAALQRVMERTAQMPATQRCGAIQMLIELYCERRDFSAAYSLLDNVTVPNVPEAVRSTLRATILRNEGRSDEARLAAKNAQLYITGDTPVVEMRTTAIELMALGMYEDALALWRRIVPRTVRTIDTQTLVRCACLAGDDVLAREFCLDLRSNGVHDSYCLQKELDVLERNNCIDEEIRLLEDLHNPLSDPVLARSARARLSLLGLQIDRADLVCTDVAQLPVPADVRPSEGHAIVHILTHGTSRQPAIEYAHALLHLHPDSAEAFQAMISAFLFGGGAGGDVASPTEVGPGTAVRVRDSLDQRERWFVIEEAFEAIAERDELSPNHPLALKLSGLRQGQAASVREHPIQDRSFLVLEIRSKYSYWLSRCLEEYETRFPNRFFMLRFVAPKDDDGTPDFSGMLRSVDQRVEWVESIEAVYRDNPVSLTHFAIIAGVNVVESAWHLSARGLPIRCCGGTHEELNAAICAATECDALVLDSTALATVFICEQLEWLESLDKTLLVTEGTLRGFGIWVAEMSQSHRSHGWFGKHDGKYVMVERSESDVTLLRDRVRAFLCQVRAVCEVIDGMCVARLEKTVRKQLLDVMKRPATEAAAAATERNAVLWTDDLAVGAIAQEKLHCKRVWTQAVLLSGVPDGRLKSDFVNRMSWQLAGFGYDYTGLNAECVREVFLDAANASHSTDLDIVLKWIRTSRTALPELYTLLVDVIRVVVRHVALEQRVVPLSIQLLNAIDGRSDGHLIMQELIRCSDEMFGVDVVNARRWREIVTGWLLSKKTSGLYLPWPCPRFCVNRDLAV